MKDDLTGDVDGRGLLQDFLDVISLVQQMRYVLLRHLLSTCNLTLEEASLLLFVGSHRSPNTVSAIADGLGRASHTASEAVTRLERKGLLERTRNPKSDRRHVDVRLTASGRSSLSRIEEILPELVALFPENSPPLLKLRISEIRRNLEQILNW